MDGCPIATYGCRDNECPNTCFCADHCSWKKCKLEIPPKDCLMYANRHWEFNQQTNYWRTDLNGILKKLFSSMINLPIHIGSIDSSSIYFENIFNREYN